ncbi:MAG: ribonuclease J [Hyphomicrobiales bacterium]|nr:ribonuclease J [Hyphomicrobiales bacterium]
MPLTPAKSEMVFLALGGVGEIGMNVYLYGVGDDANRKWLMVDLGVTFPDDREPGVDLVLPDLRFIEEERANLVGILLTHSHEDHFGAMPYLWPRLRVPVYGTRFTLEMLKSKLHDRPWRNEVPLRVVEAGARFSIAPFDLELVNMAHSIPETSGVIFRHGGGVVFHTADWKLDPAPGLGWATDTAKIEALGREGVDVMICDSTNVLSEGHTGSEADVERGLGMIIAGAQGRVAVTTFASNAARLLAVAKAAKAAGRELVLSGRAMHRVVEAARESGLWPAGFEFRTEDEFGYLPNDKVALLCTGSQGEPRAALARIAEDEHPRITLNRGDTVVFSSRTIPGNENAVLRVQNNLADQGVEVITGDDATPVHTSGHPRRGELQKMYGWAKPKTLIPVHGEPRHLEEHVRFARENGLKALGGVRNGHIVRLLPGEPEIVDEAPVGRVYRDGELIAPSEDGPVQERRKLSFAGAVTVALVLRRDGDLAADPDWVTCGVPEEDDDGEPIDEVIEKAIHGALTSIPRARRKDAELVEEAIRRSVRSAIAGVWGKKTVCSVMVSIV